MTVNDVADLLFAARGRIDFHWNFYVGGAQVKLTVEAAAASPRTGSAGRPTSGGPGA